MQSLTHTEDGDFLINSFGFGTASASVKSKRNLFYIFYLNPFQSETKPRNGMFHKVKTLQMLCIGMHTHLPLPSVSMCLFLYEAKTVDQHIC